MDKKSINNSKNSKPTKTVSGLSKKSVEAILEADKQAGSMDPKGTHQCKEVGCCKISPDGITKRDGYKRFDF